MSSNREVRAIVHLHAFDDEDEEKVTSINPGTSFDKSELINQVDIGLIANLCTLGQKGLQLQSKGRSFSSLLKTTREAVKFNKALEKADVAVCGPSEQACKEPEVKPQDYVELKEHADLVGVVLRWARHREQRLFSKLKLVMSTIHAYMQERSSGRSPRGKYEDDQFRNEHAEIATQGLWELLLNRGNSSLFEMEGRLIEPVIAHMASVQSMPKSIARTMHSIFGVGWACAFLPKSRSAFIANGGHMVLFQLLRANFIAQDMIRRQPRAQTKMILAAFTCAVCDSRTHGDFLKIGIQRQLFCRI